MNLAFSKRKILGIVILIACIFVSIAYSYSYYFIDIQNRDYFHKLIDNNATNITKEGMTDMSANNIIYSIINDVSNNSNVDITPHQQLEAVRSLSLLGDYSKTNRNTLLGILDSSGNSDNTKVSNVNRFLLTYSSLTSSSTDKT